MKNLKIVISVCFIVIVTSISFYPSLENKFTNWDDNVYVTQNPVIRDLSLKGVSRMFTSFRLGIYRPLVFLSFALEYRFFKLNPYVYHLTNLIFHLLNTLLVLLVIFILTGELRIALMVAILFGVHPMHVESVAWISERKDMLYAFFLLSALASYLNFIKKKIIKYYYLSLLLFIGSLLSKPQGMTLIFIILICDYFLGIKYNKKVFLQKIPFFIILSLFVVLTFNAAKESIYSQPEFNALDNILISCYGIVFYIFKLFIPIKLSALYPYPLKINSHLPTVFLYSPVAMAVFAAIVIKSRQYTKKVIFGTVFFFVTLLPVLQLIPSGPAIVADRYTYISFIGLFYIIVVGFFRLYDKFLQNALARAISWAMLITVVAALSFLTWHRCRVWNDGVTLWSDVLSKYPTLAMAYNSRGFVLLERKEYNKALSDFNQALQIDRNCTDAYINRGSIFLIKKEYSKAISDFNEALNKNKNDTDAYFNLGLVFKDKEEHDKAAFYFNQVLKINPRYGKAYCRLGDLYASKGDYRKALWFYNEALKIDPFYPEAYNLIAYLYGNMGYPKEAIEFWNKLLEFDPSPETYANLGSAYGVLGNYDKSIKYSEKAIKINPNFASAYGNLAVACYFKKDYVCAIKYCDKAIELRYKMNPEFLERLKPYRR